MDSYRIVNTKQDFVVMIDRVFTEICMYLPNLSLVVNLLQQHDILKSYLVDLTRERIDIYTRNN